MTARIAVFVTLFVTGAVTLALELIASRVLTPYVGGGLTVWTAILAITLAALAWGYHLGSRWSRAGKPERLFARLPAIAATVLGLTAAGYPSFLPALTIGDPVSSAFVGVTIVLAPSLVLLSAMGPLGIALTSTARGDSGAGEVFAVSTVGSVAGVFLAAFALLPFLPPPATLALLALALVATAAAQWPRTSGRGVLAVWIAGALAAIGLALATLIGAPTTIPMGALTATHVATVRSAHATILVVDARHLSRPGVVRLYLEENQIQSAHAPDLTGTPLAYVAIATRAIAEMVPTGGRVLVLGLAGGVAASDMARAGLAVEAVDVNPEAERVARAHFGLDERVVVHVEDARLFVSRCESPYDAVFVDVFSGLDVPDHLVTAEAFAAMTRCLAPDGVLVVNAVVPPIETRATARLFAGIAAGAGVDLHVFDEAPTDPARRNRIVIAARDGRPAPALPFADYPRTLFEREARVVEPISLPRAALAHVAPLTDWSNDYALALAFGGPTPSSVPVPAQWY